MISLLPALLSQLQKLLPPPSFSLETAVLEGYSRDESSQPAQMPLAVVWPETTEQVAAVLKLCNDHRVPVTARGGGSSLEGNAIPSLNSIVLSLEKMNKVLEILPEDFQVRLQPGVIYDDLNKQLARYGLFFAPWPSSGDVATIGGMVGNNAGGLNALRYGVTRDHVLQLQVALADGSLLWFGTRAMKSSSGYDMVRLIVGSEGTLGIVTEIVLRLHGLPERRTALAQFPSLDSAAQAVFEIMRSGITPGALELIDANSIHILNQFKGWDWPEHPSLIFEFHGTPKGIEEEVEIARGICGELGAVTCRARATLGRAQGDHPRRKRTVSRLHHAQRRHRRAAFTIYQHSQEGLRTGRKIQPEHFHLRPRWRWQPALAYNGAAE